MRFEWKPPHGVWDVLSRALLLFRSASPVAVVTTNFPPDDSSVGYERGTSVSKDWHEATTRPRWKWRIMSSSRLPRSRGLKPDAPDRVEKLKQFVATSPSAHSAVPRWTNSVQLYVERPFADGRRAGIAVKRAMLLDPEVAPFSLSRNRTSRRMISPRPRASPSRCGIPSGCDPPRWPGAANAHARTDPCAGRAHGAGSAQQSESRRLFSSLARDAGGGGPQQGCDRLPRILTQEIVADLRRSLELLCAT